MEVSGSIWNTGIIVLGDKKIITNHKHFGMLNTKFWIGGKDYRRTVESTHLNLAGS